MCLLKHKPCEKLKNTHFVPLKLGPTLYYYDKFNVLDDCIIDARYFIPPREI